MYADSSIHVHVDRTNPGQFFACCGLLELADRLWPGAEGWFEGRWFRIAADGTLAELIRSAATAELKQLDPNDDTASPMEIGVPFRRLRLDWWKDGQSGGRDLKVWAGSMESVRIARAMQKAMRSEEFLSEDLLDLGAVAYDPDNSAKKVEPFYFDARRAPNAHSRDVGFSPNALQVTTTAFPAVEFLCLIGLQRYRPQRTSQPRIFEYWTWNRPLPPVAASAASCGFLGNDDSQQFRFENWYRTGQRKHKAFRSAVAVNKGDDR